MTNDTTTTNTTTIPSSPIDKTITFGNVQVYEFPMELGINPACSSGAPVQTKWISKEKYMKQQREIMECDLEMYEYLRKPQRRPRRKDMILDVTQRASILMAAGHTLDEIVNATMTVEALQKQRRDTLQKNGWERFGQLLETTGRLPKGILYTTSDILTSTGGMLLNGVKAITPGVGNSTNGNGKEPRTVPARSA